MQPSVARIMCSSCDDKAAQNVPLRKDLAHGASPVLSSCLTARAANPQYPIVFHRPLALFWAGGNRALDASQYTAWQHLAWPFGNQPAQAPLTNVSPHLLNVAVRRSTSSVVRSTLSYTTDGPTAAA